jgi:RHS repeat-associated protein
LFGNAILSSGSTFNPFRFLGRIGYYWDSDVGSRYMLRARYLDSKSGRFVSRDRRARDKPWAFYVYCSNNPSRFVDPSGFDKIPNVPMPEGGTATVDCTPPSSNGAPSAPCALSDIQPIVCIGRGFCNVPKILSSSSTLRGLLGVIFSECRFTPPMLCSYCSGPCSSFDGLTFTGQGPPMIVLCANGAPDLASLVGTLYHELIHVWQGCTGLFNPITKPYGVGACAQALLDEADAYYCSGACTTPDECFVAALGSACPLGWCSPAELLSGAPQLLLRRWWNLPNKCATLPTPVPF